MAYNLQDLDSQLTKHAQEISTKIFNEFKRHVSSGDMMIDIHQHGNYSSTDITKYTKNLVICCTENRLCSDSVESIFAHAYTQGMKDCLFTLYKNGLLSNVST